MGFTTEVYEWEGDTTQAFGSFIWKSKRYLLENRPSKLYAVILFEQGDLADFEQALQDYQAAVTANQLLIASGWIFPGPQLPSGSGFQIGNRAVTGTSLQNPGPLPVYGGELSLILRVYVDGVLRFTKTVISQKPFRIPTRRRGRAWEFELEGNVDRVRRMDFASSMQEIKAAINEGG